MFSDFIVSQTERFLKKISLKPKEACAMVKENDYFRSGGLSMKQKSAEILAIGTELLMGNTVNTNAAYIARGLAQNGVNVYHQEVVGDNPQRLLDSLTRAFSRSDIVITTGGLGPTYDDLSKETIASYFGRKLVLDEESLQHI